eukprot:s78_g5.t1
MLADGPGGPSCARLRCRRTVQVVARRPRMLVHSVMQLNTAAKTARELTGRCVMTRDAARFTRYYSKPAIYCCDGSWHGHSVRPMEVKGITTASFVLSLAACGCLVAALLGPWSWGRASAAPGTRHQLVAEYDLWQAKLDVAFYPDPALPWKQALEPLRIPAVPLYHFVHGPPAVRLLQKSAEKGVRPVSWDIHTLDMPGQVEEDYDQQAATWLALTLRRSPSCLMGCGVFSENRKRNTTWTWQSTLPLAADAVEQRCGVAVALQIGSILAQVSGAALQKRARVHRAKMLCWCAMLFEVGVTVSVLSAFVCYLSRFHNKLHMLAAEFVFAQTDGAIVIWPADFRLKLGPCAIAVALSGLLSLTSSLLLVACLVARSSRAKAPSSSSETAVFRDTARGRRLRRSSSTLVAAEHLIEASVLKWKSHDRRVVAVVLLAMTLLALLLGLMAFLLGRAGVEDGAFRGPEDGLRKTTHAAQAVGHLIVKSLRKSVFFMGCGDHPVNFVVTYPLGRTVVGGSAKLLLGVVLECGKALASLGHVVALPAWPIIKTLKFIASVVTKGVTGAASWLAAAANAAASAAQAAQTAQGQVEPADAPQKEASPDDRGRGGFRRARIFFATFLLFRREGIQWGLKGYTVEECGFFLSSIREKSLGSSIARVTHDKWLLCGSRFWLKLQRSRPMSAPVVGLQNQGNTCYLNAILQCIVHTPLLYWSLQELPSDCLEREDTRWLAELKQLLEVGPVALLPTDK